jgi:hypothetical protein
LGESISSARAVSPEKAIKDMLEIVAGDPSASVRHLESDETVPGFSAKGDLSLRSMAERVRYQIVEYLRHSLQVNSDGWQQFGSLHAKVNVLLAGLHDVRQPSSFQQSLRIDRAPGEWKFTCIGKG